MDAFAYLIVFILACCFVPSEVNAAPSNEEEIPYMFTARLDVSELLLFNLIQDIDGHFSDDNVQTVMIRLMSHFSIPLDKVNISYLKPLQSKLGRLWKSWVREKGTGRKTKLLHKFENSSYSLNIPHKTGSPTKRKLEQHVDEGKRKIQKLENDLIKTDSELTKCKEVLSEANRNLDRLSNPGKRERGERGRTKGKLLYSVSQKRRHKLKKVEVAKDILNCHELLNIELLNEYGEIVKVSKNETSVSKTHTGASNSCDDNVDDLIYIMDSCYVTDCGYHEIAQRYPFLPRLCKVIKRRHDLNQMFSIKTVEGRFEGVYKSLETSLIEILSDPSYVHILEDGKIKIKFSGDGTRAGTKKHLINVSYTIVGDKNCCSERGNYLLAIVQCPETAECIQEALVDLIDEFNCLDEVHVKDKIIKVEKFVGGDLKFLNQVTGIGGFASTYSCLWCKCSKNERSDTSKTWSMTDPVKGARTIEEISECSKKPKSNKTKYNCNHAPIFPSVPIARVIPDTLHLFLRIMDQLVYQLTFYLRHQDNCVRLNQNINVEACDNLMRFQNFIKKIGISDWKFIVKDNKIETRSFTGPEHKRILANIDLDLIIPDHSKLSDIKCLWSTFKKLIGQLNCQLTSEEIDEFQTSAKAWIDMYRTVYLAKDITPYMHVLAYHVPEVMMLYGNPTYFCQQGLEKLNDQVTKWYFRATNFGKSALKQIMVKQSRLRLLEQKCKRSPRWTVTCSSCHQQDGHNRATCPADLNN